MTITAPDVRYVEHGNANAYRNYPFSETADLKDSDGAELASDVFLDAMVYPVSGGASGARLVEIRCASGSVILDCGGMEVSGTESGGCVELYDSLGRHAGTLVCGPGWERESRSGRVRSFSGLWLAPSAYCPVAYDGVVGLSGGEDGSAWRTSRRDIELSGDDVVTPVLYETTFGPELRFDVQYTPETKPTVVINQIVFAVAGRTVFDIDVTQVDDGVVELYASAIDRDDICWQAHREDSVSTVVDACENQEQCVSPVIPVKSEAVEVCPSDVGNIVLVSDDGVNYRNPVKVSVVSGSVTSQRPQISEGMGRDEVFAEAEKLLARPVVVGNGIRISMPGLTNGQ